MAFSMRSTISRFFAFFRKEFSRHRSCRHRAHRGRSFYSASGVLTIEASLILPLFLMVMCSLLCLFELLVFSLRLQMAMSEAVQKAAAYTYAIETITSGEADASELEGGDDLDGELLRAGITAVYLKTAVINRMGDNAFKRVSILGGKAGLTVLQSKFPDEDGAIDFVMTYEARMPFLPGRAGVVICSQRTHCYAWKGTKRWAGSEQPAEENDDPVVYVTEHGTVYHTDLNCTYLNRTVESAFLKQIQYMRNDSGGKYTLCERCGKYNVIGPVYYTKYGDRYHTILSCPALERNIRQIRLSEAGGKPLCSKCAKSGRKE